MARKTNTDEKNSGNRTSNGNGKQWSNKLIFHSPTLNAADKKWLGDNIHDAHVTVAEFITELPETIQLSSKIDTHSGMWMATAIGIGDGHAYSGQALVCRNRDRFLALYGLSYLHNIKLEGDWGLGDPENEDGWG